MSQPQMLDSHLSWEPAEFPLAVQEILGTESSKVQTATSSSGTPVVVGTATVVGAAVVVAGAAVVVDVWATADVSIVVVTDSQSDP